MIDPERIKINEQPPPVVIEQIRIDDQSIAPSEKIEVAAGHDATRLLLHCAEFRSAREGPVQVQTGRL